MRRVELLVIVALLALSLTGFSCTRPYVRLGPYEANCKPVCFETCGKLAPLPHAKNGSADECYSLLERDGLICGRGQPADPDAGKPAIPSQHQGVLDECDAHREACAYCLRELESHQVIKLK